jgi:hypothetical protein
MADDTQDILTPAQRKVLIAAATMFIDEAFEDIKDISKGGDIDDTATFAYCLPGQFQHHYTGIFLKQFLVCAIRVADRLAHWHGGEIPSCTAECLALRGIIREAECMLDEKAEQEGTKLECDFDPFIDEAFPDLDINLLFDQALDGIEDTPKAKEMGMYLKPSQWFEPAYGDVHPFCL